MKSKTNRRRFIEVLGLTTVASAIHIPSVFSEETLEEKELKHGFLTSPYLQALSSSVVVIV